MRLQRYYTASVGWHVLLVWQPSPSEPVAAYCGATLNGSQHAAQIDTLGVALSHRRRGIGRALLRRVERKVAAREVRRVDVVLHAPLDSSLADLDAMDDGYSEIAAARLLSASGYVPCKRVEPNQQTCGAFELWRKVLNENDVDAAEVATLRQRRRLVVDDDDDAMQS